MTIFLDAEGFFNITATAKQLQQTRTALISSIVSRAEGTLNCSNDFKERNFASFKINDLAGVEITSHVALLPIGHVRRVA
jgi:hypothetical protein